MLNNDVDPADQNSHALAIETLAAELRVPIDEVRRTYNQQLERLKADARISDFLLVFVMRSTRDMLRSSH